MPDAVPIDPIGSPSTTLITVSKDTLKHPAFWILVGLGLGAFYTYFIVKAHRTKH